MNKKVNRSIQFKNGSFSLILTVIAIAIVVLINFIFAAFPTDKMTFSTEGTDLYSLSDTTRNLLNTQVKNDITLYILSDSMGSYDDYSVNLCKAYEDADSHIKVKKIDKAVNPAFTSKYEAALASDSSVIVENSSSKKYILVDFNDMHQTKSDEKTEYKTEKYNGEGLLTSAINKVSVSKETRIYQLGGHGEPLISKENYALLCDALDKSAYSLSETPLVLSEAGALPADLDILIIFYPAADISENDLGILKEYLSNGGRIAIIHNNITLLNGSSGSVSYDNLYKLINYGGLMISEDFIVENDYDHYMSSAVNYPKELIIPDYGSKVSKAVTSSGKTLAAFASPLSKFSNEGTEYEYTDLLITSSAITSFLEENKRLPANTSVASVSKLSGASKKGSLFVVSDAMFFNLSAIFGSAGDAATESNIRLFTEGLNIMSDNAVDSYVPVKSFERKVNIVADGNVLTFSLIYIAVFPIAILAIGFVIWMLRRSR